MVNRDYSLYLVTDRELLQGRDLLTEVRKAIKGGVSMVQLREKSISSLDFYNLAVALKEELSHYQVPLIINDRLDIALAVDADGLHIGQDDLPFSVARRLLGPDKILGLSVTTLEEAREGEKLGATYFGAGPAFYTATKADAAAPMGCQVLKVIKETMTTPVVAIGGINMDNIERVKETGVEGVAVVSALMGQEDIEMAARRMRNIWEES
ncbi:MAG: thiamine phosphate synthase [Syntrophomonadaceae bacterium]|nr:thiamine phosphate synthase [Syntrophomonadaceae bacterium]